jgi:abortive infection bacteriophage resistance protein
MNVEDDAKASEYLQRIGYYRLSGYWHPMRERTPAGDVLDTFQAGTTFKEATDLYTFDSRLRLIMLNALERLEVSLRTEVALTLGAYHNQAHRSLAYLGPSFAKSKNRNGPTKHREWLQ